MRGPDPLGPRRIMLSHCIIHFSDTPMRWRIVLSLCLVLTHSLPAADPPKIALVIEKPGEPPVVVVSGLSSETIARLKAAKLDSRQWTKVLRVVVAGGTAEEESERLSVVGSCTLTETGIRFEPRFSLLPGRDYRAVLHLDAKSPIEATLTVPRPPPGPRISITHVYPSGNQLPENTLRFYIHFSGQVARGDVYHHLKLVRDDGIEVKSPFLELDEELWSVDGTRLTVLFHPGRVKRELVPREEEGPILEAGHGYTLSISDKWQDAEGRPLVSGYVKKFRATSADDQAVDPEEWKLVAPRAGSEDPLLIRLSKPLDHALLGRLVWIADTDGNKLPGRLTVGGGERVLTFTPKGPWKKGDHYLIVNTRLEDVCGNRVGEPFEVALDKPATPKQEAETVERVFRVR